MGDDRQEPMHGPLVTAGGERVKVWLSEQGLTGLLIMLVVDIFLLPIFGPGLGHITLDIVFSVLLVTGVAALCERRFPRILALVFATLTLASQWLERVGVDGFTILSSTVASLTTMVIFSLLVLFRTMSPGPITRFRIQGAVAAYMLIGLTFGLAFRITELLEPGAFQFAVDLLPSEIAYELGYFSLVTLTTVGYGDVTPVSAMARSLAIFEGLIGQLYPVIILGWMVASLRTRQHD